MPLVINILIVLAIACVTLALVGFLIFMLDRAASPCGERKDRGPTLLTRLHLIGEGLLCLGRVIFRKSLAKRARAAAEGRTGNLETTLAIRGMAVEMAIIRAYLKYRLLAPFCTVGANAMYGLARRCVLPEPQNHTVKPGIPEKVVLLLFLECIRLSQLRTQLGYPVSQLGIRGLRIRILRLKIRDGHFDLWVSTNLRTVEKRFELLNRDGGTADGICTVCNDARQMAGEFNQIHPIVSLWCCTWGERLRRFLAGKRRSRHSN